MFHRGWFHIAMAQQKLQEAVCRVLMQYGTARITTGAATFPQNSDTSRYAGVVCEWNDDSRAWLARLRSAAPCLPVLTFVPRTQVHLLNELHANSVEVALLPLHLAQLTAFAQRALACQLLPSERVARMVSFVAQTRGLSPREVQLLSYCLGDEPRARIRRRLGITENTLKSQVKGLLRKCGERNVDSLAKNVLRAALLEGLPQSMQREPVAPWYPAQGAA